MLALAVVTVAVLAFHAAIAILLACKARGREEMKETYCIYRTFQFPSIRWNRREAFCACICNKIALNANMCKKQTEK